MNNHWPLVAAGVMISVAVVLGLWRRDTTIEALSARTVNVPAPAPKKRETLPAEAPPKDEAKAPAPLPAANTATATGTATASPAAPAIPAAPAKPAAPPASKFALPSAAPAAGPAQPAPAPAQPAQPAPAQPAPAHPAPAQPAVQAAPAPAPAQPPAGGHGKVLLDLRKSLEGKLTTPATDIANGGYVLQVTGARLEVSTQQYWSINIYNSNAAQADVETDNFKVIYNEVATVLGLNVNQKPATLNDGKTSMQSASKLGSVSIVRDPQTGNSVVITPNQQRKAMVQPPAQPAQPAAQPAQPQPAPAQPAAQPNQPAAQPKAQAQPAQPAPATPPAQPKQ